MSWISGEVTAVLVIEQRTSKERCVHRMFAAIEFAVKVTKEVAFTKSHSEATH